ncbi:hypothetical protein [Tabrizicola sp. M-4]|uniref:hypothetical protein n=1 Tax=Tabrizicola sp. M-4 TaxID=3055847 RepID=UPI003DA9EFDC
MTMNLYLVRKHGSFQIHGIFWANNHADLWDAVDEMADPVEFEWSKITKPGGIWHDVPFEHCKDTAQWGEGHNPSDDFCLHGLCRPGEYLTGMVSNQDQHEWTRFDAFDEGHGLLARIRSGHG